MTGELPRPPIDPKADLTSFCEMRFDVVRFKGSMLAMSDPAAIAAAILLWCEAWHQLPASSLPDDDVWLAMHGGFGRDVEGWQRVRPAALRGWYKCSDERLYHPLLAEKADASWIGKQKRKRQTETARKVAKIRRKHKPQKALMTRSVTESVTDIVTESVTESVTEEREDRRGEDRQVPTGDLSSDHQDRLRDAGADLAPTPTRFWGGLARVTSEETVLQALREVRELQGGRPVSYGALVRHLRTDYGIELGEAP